MVRFPQTPPPADAALRRAAKPVVVYALDGTAIDGAPLSDDARVGLTKIGETIVPPREGRAFDVPAGHFFRIVSIEGPQVGDLTCGTPPISPNASSAARRARSTRRM
jgi:uncharacterized protein YcgI (DUF1989 family)